MIKDFFGRIKGPHLFVFLIFLGLGFIVLALSVKGYKEYSQHEISATDASGRHDLDLSTEDLMAILRTSREAPIEAFEIVSQKNLFSPDREAWEPPPPSDDQEEQTPARTRRINPNEFKLYGVTSFKDDKMALVYYQRLPENSRNRLVSEGDTVYQQRDGGTEVFRVVSIGNDSVTLEAQGNLFEVGLFSHERQQVDTAVQDKVAVVISGTSEPSDVDPIDISTESARKDPDSPGKAKVTDSASIDDSGQEASVSSEQRPDEGVGTEDQQTRASLPELLQKMREEAVHEEAQDQAQQRQQHIDAMERQVEEGTRIRIDTPFGPVYRPVN